MQLIHKQPARQDIINLDINTAVRLHPHLEVLNKISFIGWYDFQFKSFYIEYGNNLEKAILTKDVVYIKNEIESYIGERG